MIDATLMRDLTLLVVQASEAILDVPRSALGVRGKDDLSPVTIADERSNHVIAEGLARLMPGLPVVSEETAGCHLDRKPDGLFALVDPLDGTKEFIAGRDEYTVNVAIIEDGVPVAGFMSAPARRLIYRGMIGHGADRVAFAQGSVSSDIVPIHCRALPTAGATALVSRSHPDAATSSFLDRVRIADRRACGSALKFGHVAEGDADLYARLAPTSEWDIAAGHAILAAAGGGVSRPDGEALLYQGGVADICVPAFVAWGDPELSALLRQMQL